MWVGEAWPVSRMYRMVLACHTESQVLGIDCQCANPAAAAAKIRIAPRPMPAATSITGPREAALASAS